jgi:uncharacterized membrane protein
MPSPADWRLKSCLWFAGITSALQLLLVILGSCGIYIPVLNQVAGFIFLTFVPGLLLLRILRVRGIDPLEAVAYSVGLSLFSIMMCGAFVNFILPLMGIAHPVTPLPVVISLCILYAALMVLARLREPRVQTVEKVTQYGMGGKTALLMLLLLLMVILGVLALEKTGSNVVLIICIFAVALYLLLGTFKWGIPEVAYPIAIFTISLALLYQTTLISPYLIGSDIYFEYQFSQPVALNGIWDYTLPGTINSCLSIVMAVPIFAQMLHIDGALVFKAVYPVIFSLVPLVMYRFMRIQTGRLPAFLAVFFFMSVPTFSLELISLGRQQFAELFFALLMLLLTDRKIDKAAKTAMLIIFALGVTVSHYTLGFINFVYMGALIFLLIIMRSKPFLQAWGKITAGTGGVPLHLRYPGPDSLPLKHLSISFIVIVVLSLAWYGLIASASNLQFFAGTLVILLQKIGVNIEGLASLTGNPSQYLFGGQSDVIISAALGMDFSQVSLQGKVFRILQYITQLLIVAGCLRLVVRPSGLKLSREYIAFSLVAAVTLAACIVLPWFSNILNITRWYHIALISLAPFLVIGAQYLWELGAWALRKGKDAASQFDIAGDSKYLNYLAVLVILPYFIFTSGLVFEFSSQSDTNVIDTPYSIALSSNRLDLSGIFNHQDGAAALWLSRHTADNTTVYTDVHARKIILFQDHPVHLIVAEFKRKDMQIEDGYIFLTTWNVNKDELAFTNTGRPGMREHLGVRAVPGLADALQNGNRIYADGGSQVYITSGTK